MENKLPVGCLMQGSSEGRCDFTAWCSTELDAALWACTKVQQRGEDNTGVELLSMSMFRSYHCRMLYFTIN